MIATNYCKYKGIFIATTNRIECQNYHNFTIARWPEKGNSQEFILEIQDGGRPTCWQIYVYGIRSNDGEEIMYVNADYDC